MSDSKPVTDANNPIKFEQTKLEKMREDVIGLNKISKSDAKKAKEQRDKREKASKEKLKQESFKSHSLSWFNPRRHNDEREKVIESLTDYCPSVNKKQSESTIETLMTSHLDTTDKATVQACATSAAVVNYLGASENFMLGTHSVYADNIQKTKAAILAKAKAERQTANQANANQSSIGVG
ncbi:hypothetical protein [Candidatus Paracaedibacter symbiosus]|uniref:hypothetical protein n=1 Tax=Candidatus Paracaedibacter symbiosus TaxID=244582 RepID=UPI0005093BC2|nr:hypothetical protein [Candidatus Paracaedibacter symbiosus]